MFRALNANLLGGDQMKYYRHVNLGVAVDTDRGLMVPTIFKADTLSLKEISQVAKKLANDCKAGTINPDLLRDGSFTVSNLGSLGIESFTPVINPPQTGILGVNTIVERACAIVDGQLALYPSMTLSLTYDHRALDGAAGSRGSCTRCARTWKTSRCCWRNKEEGSTMGYDLIILGGGPAGYLGGGTRRA